MEAPLKRALRVCDEVMNFHFFQVLCFESGSGQISSFVQHYIG